MKPLLAACALGLLALAGCATVPGGAAGAAPIPSSAAIDAEVARAMAATGARGMAVAVIENGRPVHVKSYGHRNAAGASLQTNTDHALVADSGAAQSHFTRRAARRSLCREA